MKVIVGLGNPGPEYAKTRHNAGFMVIDRLIERHAKGAPLKGRFHAGVVEASIPGVGKCLLVKPTTFMNLSGQSVQAACAFYKVDPQADLLVVVDEVALATGILKLNASGGAGGHNGLKDIARKLGGEAYPRLRFGIGQPPPPITRHDWVLGRFTEAELGVLDGALGKAADACERFAAEGIDAAMNAFNGAAGGTGGSGWGKKPDPKQETEDTDPGWFSG